MMPGCNWTSEITSQKNAAHAVKVHMHETAHSDYVPTTLWNLLTEEDGK